MDSGKKLDSLMQSLGIRYKKNQIIFREGETTRELYILISGEVQIRKNNTVIGTVGTPDTYLGEMSTLLGSPRTATLAALTDCVMVRVPEDKVIEFIQHSPYLGIKLAKTLALRLRDMNAKYERLLKRIAAAKKHHEFESLPGVSRKT